MSGLSTLSAIVPSAIESPLSADSRVTPLPTEIDAGRHVLCRPHRPPTGTSEAFLSRPRAGTQERSCRVACRTDLIARDRLRRLGRYNITFLTGFEAVLAWTASFSSWFSAQQWSVSLSNESAVESTLMSQVLMTAACYGAPNGPLTSCVTCHRSIVASMNQRNCLEQGRQSASAELLPSPAVRPH